MFLNMLFFRPCANVMCRSCCTECNTRTDAFVNAYSTRSEYRKGASALNAKCSPATPFLLDFPHAQLLFNERFSAFVNSNQPAGDEALCLCFALKHVLPSHHCSHSSAAFVVATNDTRFILREITHVAAPTLLCLFFSCSNLFIRGMLSHKLLAEAGTHWHLPLQETCKYPRSDLRLSFPSQRLKTIPIFAFLPISTVQNHTPWISPHAPARYSWGDNSNG